MTQPKAKREKRHYRTIWISDIHLGTRGSKADYLLDFIKYNNSDTLYLVGDIIDGWQLRKSWYWKQSHNDVVQKLLRKARKGTEVIYIPGNHDEFARQFCGLDFGDIKIRRNHAYTTADGKRLLILHGDEYDGVMQHAKWLAYVGDWLYNRAISINNIYNRFRNYFGKPYWSLSQYLKHKVKNAVSFITAFEKILADAAKRKGFDGVVCGHIHQAEIKDYDGIHYYNCGDWVESITALVEHEDGRMEIIYWADVMTQEQADIAEDADVEETSPADFSADLSASAVDLAAMDAKNGNVKSDIEQSIRKLTKP